MEFEVLLNLIELILTQKDGNDHFVENIIKRNFVVGHEDLLVATKLRQIELVRFVLKNEVKPTLESFQYAAEHEFFEICRLFVEFGSRKLLSTQLLEEKLYLLIRSNNLSEAKKIINQGIDLTADNNMFIQVASERGNIEIIHLLLEHGVDITANNNEAIQRASDEGHLEVVRLLLQHGAIPTDEAIKSASRRGHLEVVRLLLKHGANSSTGNNYSIKIASKFGYIEIIKLLLEYGADINADGDEVIQYASIGNHIETIRFLLEHGANPTSTTNRSIYWASFNNNEEAIRLFLKYGANVKANENEAIVIASEGGHLEIVQLLLDCGADSSDLAIKMAKKNYYMETVQLLKKYKPKTGGLFSRLFG